MPVFDLVKGRCAVFGHCILCAGILRLKNSNAISLRVKDYHIAAPFSMLLIGVHLIARSRKNSSQERMVKIFFVVMVADGFTEELVHLLCKSLRFTRPNGIE